LLDAYSLYLKSYENVLFDTRIKGVVCCIELALFR